MSAPAGSTASTAVSGATRKAGGRWFTLFTLAWLVIWTAQLTPLQLLLPLQLDGLVGGTDWVAGVVASGIVLGIGGFVGVIAGPIAGALSDRGTGRIGRRRPWALLGTAITALCLLLLGLAQGVWQVALAWIGVSVGIAVMSAAFTALIADQLAARQRGAASSVVGSAQAVGIVLGVGTVVLLGLGVFDGYVVLAVAVAIVGTLTALLLPDPPAAVGRHGVGADPANAGTAGSAGLSLSPARLRDGLASLKDRDFRWMLGGRLVVNIGNSLGTALFLFFLLYGLHQPHAVAEENLLLLILVYTLFVVIASIATGVISDRTGKRRGLTVAAGFVQATCGIAVVILPTFEVTMIAAALMGLGYGAFSSVGLAFATDLLPNPADHARDLGIVNTTAQLGQLIGPVLGAGLVALVGGFWLVFALSAVLSVVGALMSSMARESAPQSVPDLQA